MDGETVGGNYLFNTFYGSSEMKLEFYDNIKLNAEVEDLAMRDIHKGCLGTIAKLGAKKA